MSRNLALYIHFPFCRHKCSYCSFVSYPFREADIPRYLDALEGELRQKAKGENVRSIYLGGGTPSLLSVTRAGRVISVIGSLFDVDETAEISLEANPGTIDTEYLKGIRELGFNRLSLGVQSFNDDELKLLGRIHTADGAEEAVSRARDAGFDNLNIDLIYGLPGQTPESWRRTLEAAVSLGPEHLSLYALTLEEDVPMWSVIREGSLPEPDPDAAAGFYEAAEGFLDAAGYGHYEISNWSLPGRECRHNLTYWRNRPYLGVGVAAHSWLDGHRSGNTKNLDEYLAGSPAALLPEIDETIGPETELAETVILGLRLGKGIDAEEVSRRFGIDILERYRQQIDEMVKAGLLQQAGNILQLTGRGRLLSNEVFWRFLPE